MSTEQLTQTQSVEPQLIAHDVPKKGGKKRKAVADGEEKPKRAPKKQKVSGNTVVFNTQATTIISTVKRPSECLSIITDKRYPKRIKSILVYESSDSSSFSDSE